MASLVSLRGKCEEKHFHKVDSFSYNYQQLPILSNVPKGTGNYINIYTSDDSEIVPERHGLCLQEIIFFTWFATLYPLKATGDAILEFHGFITYVVISYCDFSVDRDVMIRMLHPSKQRPLNMLNIQANLFVSYV